MLTGYPDISTAEEVREALRSIFNTLYEMLKSGKLKAFRNDRHRRIPKATVEKYIKETAKLR